MKCEIPEFGRCCCCIPLRRGLLAWSYFKIIADALLIFFMTLLFLDIRHVTTELIASIITAVLFLTDFIVTIVFIVGGHKKNVQLIRICYYLSIGLWVATFFLASFTTISILHDAFRYPLYHFLQLVYIMVPISFFFVTLAVQAYFLLLLRSEIIKLSNVGEFRFVNNAAEAECTMRFEEVTVATEAVKSDH